MSTIVVLKHKHLHGLAWECKMLIIKITTDIQTDYAKKLPFHKRKNTKALGIRCSGETASVMYTSQTGATAKSKLKYFV